MQGRHTKPESITVSAAVPILVRQYHLEATQERGPGKASFWLLISVETICHGIEGRLVGATSARVAGVLAVAFHIATGPRYKSSLPHLQQI